MLRRKTNMPKRLVALVLCLCSLNVGAYAAPAAATTKPAKAPTMESSIENENILLIDGIAPALDAPDSIQYNYAISNDDDDGVVNVNMDITLLYLNQSSSFSVAGEIPVFELPSGEKYMYGPLEGAATIGGSVYNAVVGFQKMSSSPDISAALTLENEGAEAIFKFGDLHVKYSAVQSVLPQTSTMSDTPSGNSNRAANANEYVLLNRKVNSLNGKTAIKEEVWYSSSNQRIMLTVLPSLANVESIHTISGTTTASASVDRIKMHITEKADTQTSISGLVLGDSTAISTSGGFAKGTDALNLIVAISALKYEKTSGVLAIIAALAEMLVKTIEIDVQQGVDRVTAEYRNLQMADKRWDEYGVSIAFELRKRNPGSIAKASYNYYCELRYHVAVTDFMGDVSQVYRTVDVSADQAVTLA